MKARIVGIKLFAVVAAILALTFALASATASAATGPKWRVDSLSDTAFTPGETTEYVVQFANVGDQATNGEEIDITAELPSGLRAVAGTVFMGGHLEEILLSECTAGDGSAIAEAEDVKCTNTKNVPAAAGGGAENYERLVLTVRAAPDLAEGLVSSSFGVSGGGAAGATSVDVSRIRDGATPFGIDTFDIQYLSPSGTFEVNAGSHPAVLNTSVDLNTYDKPVPLGGVGWPVEPFKDGFAELPPGLIGNPAAADTCLASELTLGGNTFKTSCPPSSQVGIVRLRWNNKVLFPVSLNLPVYNLVVPIGKAARFGFNAFGAPILLDARVRSERDYRITVEALNASEAVNLAGASFEFWGDPSGSAHDLERACPQGEPPATGIGGPVCPTTAQPRAFLRSPTACQGPQESRLRANSWPHPTVFAEASSISHNGPGYPYSPQPSLFPPAYSGPTSWGAEQGFENCDAEPFSPTLSGGPPSGSHAGQPSSFSFDLSMPQEGFTDPAAISESDLRKAVVTLPEGVRVNPASADGLGACTPAQAGLTTPVGQTPPHFTNDAGNCPENAKLGSLSIRTPVLDHEISGAVYLAEPMQNPFGSLLALYLIAHDPVSGVNIKLAGRVDVDPNTGQITTTFDDNPQLPFEALHLELKSGPRAALTAPSACAPYTTTSEFTGWSGATVQGSSSFTIDQNCAPQGFAPQLSAGTQNPLAGSYSPFALRLTRTDADQELASLSVSMPEGLIGRLAGIPYCPQSAIDAATARSGIGQGALELATPSCPAASQVGSVTAGAGAGPSPFFVTSGRAYLAGPYRGAPLSLLTEVPALAGPFDLGTTVVRVALNINPETTQITALSDPLPQILHGIPLDLRDVRLELDRPNFTLNPTSCEPMAITSQISSTTGASASPSVRFQVAGCDRLGFKPRLSLSLRGAVHRRAHPSLIATLKARPGDANIARAQVKLPPAAFLDQAHIGTVCTRPAFAAHSCPARSIYGTVEATSPILDYPLTGKVYLRSSSHQLPDLLAVLRGPDSQPIEVDLAGRTDSVKGALRNTFELIPDVPVTKFRLQLFGGRRGLIEMSSGFCAHPRATVRLDGQNGKQLNLWPVVKADCGKKQGKHKRHS